jgi:arsenate reductase (glutaredoxin)
MAMTFYHNPRCSKSRAALELLRARDVPVRVVEYLKSPPDAVELRKLARALGGARAMVRDNETAYRDAGLDADSSDAQLLAAIAAHPILLQRPILTRDGKAAIGRPPEALLALL